MSHNYENILYIISYVKEGLCPLDHMQEVYLDIFHMAVIIVGGEVGGIFAIFQSSEDFRLDVIFIHAVVIAYVPYGFRHKVNHKVEVFGCNGVNAIWCFHGVNKMVGANGFHGVCSPFLFLRVLYHLFRKLQYLFSLFIIYNFRNTRMYYI